MKSILLTSFLVVTGTILSLVHALGSNKSVQPTGSQHGSDLNNQKGSVVDSLMSFHHPSTNLKNWKFYQQHLPDDAHSVNRVDFKTFKHPRRAYDAPLFLGKRTRNLLNKSLRQRRSVDDDLNDEKQTKRSFSIPQFVGKRPYDIPAFLGKRPYDLPQFVGRRYDIPAFLGKRKFLAPSFIGKKMSAPHFVGKRAQDMPIFVGKKEFGPPRFVGKRGLDIPAFVGKRGIDIPAFIGKKISDAPIYVKERGFDIPSFVGKRDFDTPAFVGKRKEESLKDLLVTLQAYREYRRLMQTDKRFEAPLFVDDVHAKLYLPIDDVHKVDNSKMDEPNVQLWEQELLKPQSSRFLKLDPSHALGFLGQGPSQISKRYLEFVGKRSPSKRYLEFLGKRSDMMDNDDKRLDRNFLSDYLNKRLRLRQPEFIGKRGSNQKRYLEFVGK